MPFVALLSKEEVSTYWSNIEWRIDATPGMARWYSKQDVMDLVQKEEMQVWTAGSDLVLMTAIMTTPIGKVLQIVFAHGTGFPQHFDELKEKFHLFAWMGGCERIEICGRPGWSRRLQKELGFQLDYVAYSAPVQKPRMNA